MHNNLMDQCIILYKVPEGWIQVCSIENSQYCLMRLKELNEKDKEDAIAKGYGGFTDLKLTKNFKKISIIRQNITSLSNANFNSLKTSLESTTLISSC